MNVFHKITLQSLKRNKTRTVVTIIGITLSAAMICAVTTFTSSFRNHIDQYIIYKYGDWHGHTDQADEKTLEFLTESNEVKSLVWGQQYGYALTESVNEYKPYLYLLGANEEFAKTMPVHITQGRYPQRQNEILLPLHFLSDGGVQLKIGDEITLTIGKRMLKDRFLWQTARYDLQEEFQPERQQTFTVVGFYSRPSFEFRFSPGYTAITLPDETADQFDVFFKMKNPNETWSFAEEHHISLIRTRDYYPYSESWANNYWVFEFILFQLSAVAMLLIMFGAIALIYNAFSISVSSRTKQFGLLASLGASKRQLRRMVLFEAMVVSAVGIPLGILSGIGGIGITLQIIGHLFEKLTGIPIPLRISVSPAAVILAIAVSLITVLISARKPSRRAMKVSAVEAIRQTRDIKSKPKDVKTSKLTYRLFGLSGALAAKHYKRNRKQYRATVLSLFMSVVLFISASAFSNYLANSMEQVINKKDYDILIYVDSDAFEATTPKAFLNALTCTSGYLDGVYTRSSSGSLKSISADLITDAYQKTTGTSTYEKLGITWEDRVKVSPREIFLNDDAFFDLVKELELNVNDYNDPDHPLAIVIDGTLPEYIEGQYRTIKMLKEGVSGELRWIEAIRFEGYKEGKVWSDKNGNRYMRYYEKNGSRSIFIPFEDAIREKELHFGTVIYDSPYFVSNPLVLLYPESMFSAVFPDKEQDVHYDYYIKSSNHVETVKEIRELLYDYELIGKAQLQDLHEAEDESRSRILIIRVFAYGFVVLISLIAAANVFNTISTNISLRRREFAMLKSVGMTAGGFNRMMIYECLLYGSRALLWGLPVSVGVTYLIYLSVDQGFDTQFRLPLSAIGIAVLSVFAVVFVTMMYALRKIKKENPIDAMKNENL